MPEVREGDQIAALILDHAELREGDVIAISQKIVSKAEGRIRRLADVTPGPQAAELAAATGRDPRLVELILSESHEVLRATEAALITETHHGFICANAGIDASNLVEWDSVALLPVDPDRSARTIREALASQVDGTPPAVLITDSFGRPWRLGQVEIAIGCAGIAPLDDWRGRTDRSGRHLAATEIAAADQIAAASDLARNKTSGTPVVILRGLESLVTTGHGPGCVAQLRPTDQDLFR